ncbi:MAG: hypothetical protein JNN16_10085 [Nitrospira sp.]|nr:hypothetical protein [Nitrospira sp.]
MGPNSGVRKGFTAGAQGDSSVDGGPPVGAMADEPTLESEEELLSFSHAQSEFAFLDVQRHFEMT